MRALRTPMLVVLLIASFMALPTYAAIPPSERAALDTLYSQTDGPSWANHTGWESSSGTECTWFGVTCDANSGHVLGLYLDLNNLTGTIPSLAAFTYLSSFCAHNNRLSGPMPSLSGLTNLTYFDVDGNYLTGAIPPLTGLVSLQYFIAYDNRLTGSIPALVGLGNLIEFEVADNSLTGSLPPLAGLTNLSTLNVSLNQISGPIPSLAGLTGLHSFNVGFNLITGTVPPVPSPNNLYAISSSLCPNPLTVTTDLAWDAATGDTPWSTGCTNHPKRFTFTSLTSNLNPSIRGDTTTLTASIHGWIPTGTVTFTDGTSVLCNQIAVASLGNGAMATCETSTLAVGSHSITATYSGDANNDFSYSLALTQIITQTAPVATTIDFTSSVNPSTQSSFPDLIVTITGNNPTGMVLFNNGSVTLCSSPLSPTRTVNTSTADCNKTFGLTVGAYLLTASYDGDPNNLPSSASLTQVVDPSPTTTTLVSSNNPSPQNQPVTLIATVNGRAATGTVTFLDGSATLCDAVPVSGPHETCSASTLAIGAHTLTALYSGDANNAASSGTWAQTIVAAPNATVMTLASSANPSLVGQGVTLTATILGVNPTGTVTFSDDVWTLCSNVTVQNVGDQGKAYCVTGAGLPGLDPNDSPFYVGAHSLLATYSGDANNAGLASQLALVVNEPPSFNPNQFGLTGSWYNSVTSGQGLLIEIYPDLVSAGTGIFAGGLFAYSSDGSAREWYTIQGPVSSSGGSASLDLYAPAGAGNFGSGPKVAAVKVGQVTVIFGDCGYMTLVYGFTDGSNRSGVIPLTRLDTNVSCTNAQDNGAGAGSTYLLSGAWFNPSFSGQGMFFDLNPSEGVLFAAWYTFSPLGVPTWYTIQGSLVAGAKSVSNIGIYTASGGAFNVPKPVTTSQVGTANISLTNCSSITVEYSFTGGDNAGRTGSMTLEPVGPIPSGCK